MFYPESIFRLIFMFLSDKAVMSVTASNEVCGSSSELLKQRAAWGAIQAAAAFKSQGGLV